MVTPLISNGTLILTVEGLDKFLALKSELTIPLVHIRGISAEPNAFDIPKGFRFPGGAIPGIFYAGTFYNDGEKVFWDVHNPENAIIIELEHENFNRLIIEVEEPQTTVGMVMNAIKNL